MTEMLISETVANSPSQGHLPVRSDQGSLYSLPGSLWLCAAHELEEPGSALCCTWVGPSGAMAVPWNLLFGPHYALVSGGRGVEEQVGWLSQRGKVCGYRRCAVPCRQGPGMGSLRSWERKGRQRAYMSPLLVVQSFSHPLTHLFVTLFIHSPSSLLAITVNKALCWALGESRETIHTPSPSGAHRLEEELRGGARRKTL